MLKKVKQYRFLFEELVKRDFKKKYKRTTLGILWSMISPLLQLLVMNWVFLGFFGRSMPHFTIYLFSGNLVFSFFSEATNNGMEALASNASIFSKINVPKYMFLLSKNVSSVINFLLTLVIYFIFVASDGLPFTPKFFLLIYPIICLVIFNIGVGLILSALHVFFKDISYLYNIFTLLLMYLSAIFYNIANYSPSSQRLFHLNPVYNYILYFRTIVIDGAIPGMWTHVLCVGFAMGALLIGAAMYYKYNFKFVFYLD